MVFHIDDIFSNADISRTVRFTENIFEELNQVSANNNISFNKLVLLCCRYALDHLEADE